MSTKSRIDGDTDAKAEGPTTTKAWFLMKSALI